MADTPANGETVTPEAPKNNAPANATTQVNADAQADMERYKKEAEQATMRANQLANQLKAKEDAEAATEAKKLEEQNQFKTLYEQEKAKREEVERERQAEAKKKSVADAKTAALKEYSDEVKALAEDTGLDLADDSEDSVKAYTDKLDKIQTRLGSPKMTANNPRPQSGTGGEPTGVDLYLILNDPVKRDEYYRKKGGVTAAMMAPERK